MHDVVHSFAASIPSEHHHVFTAAYHTELEEWPNKDFFEQCTSISLPYCKIPKLPEVFECPKLESFFMFNNSLLKIPENLFSRMEELKVLDLTGMHLSPLPLSLQYLENLQTLCLDQCVLEDISAIGELKQLQVLSFIQSTIVRLPSEILSRLAQLEELYMGDGFVQWKGEGHDEPRNNANLSELKLLSKLSTLEVHIMDANIMPKDLFSTKLERFRVFIGDEWDWDRYECEVSNDYKTLKLKLGRSALLERVKVLLMKTEDLYLDDLRGLRSVLYELDDQGFPELKHLHVQNSLGIQYIIDWMIMGHSTAFPRLESLFIDNLHNLEKIYYGPYMVGSFSNLRKLKVGNCNALRSLFSFSMFKGLGKLEVVDMSSCEIMEEIAVEEGEDDEEINLTQIRSLTLDNLPQLTSFCSQGQEKCVLHPKERKRKQQLLQALKKLYARTRMKLRCHFSAQRVSEAPVVERSQLRTLDIRDLPNLKQVWNMDPHGILSFYNLRLVYAWNCPKLKSLFPFSIALGLPHLALLSINGCGMEEVVAKEESVEAISINPKFVFRGLKALVLWQLEELRISRNARNTYRWAKSQLKIQVPQPLFAFREVGFSGLQHLELSQFPELKAVWQDKLPFNFFYNLSRLVVDECMFPSSSVPSGLLPILNNLDKLEVRNCDFMKEVFGTEWENANSVVGHLSKLNELDLINLPMLRRLWIEVPNGILDLRNLKLLKIHNCSSLRNIFTPTICSRLEQLQVLEVKSCAMVKQSSQKA
ncbi:hypothetical protein GH714_024559 [Hevea brasiliensis]|uniref:Disease resistance protein At4g27190-like leucine-rich repeats domain-containing protein n=1 Tax=Hevea brasiliensis TaxID=3981 RepID=A0A6A6L3K7_HEVBR|nr:hypothetical protein GH714_024559 [Hevea brasiliensis]